MARRKERVKYTVTVYPPNGEPVQRELMGTGDWTPEGELIIFDGDSLAYKTNLPYEFQAAEEEEDHTDVVSEE